MFSYRNIAKHLNITNFYFFMKNTNIQEYLENLFINNIYESNKLLTLEETIQVNDFLCSLEEKLDFIVSNTKIKSNTTEDLYLLEKFGRRAANVEVIKPDTATENQKNRIAKIVNNPDSSDDDKLLDQLEDYYNNIDCSQKQAVLISSINMYIHLATIGSANEKHANNFVDKLKDLRTRTEEFTMEPRFH